MNPTLQAGRTGAGGWLAYCEWARGILRESPDEGVLAAEIQEQIDGNQLTILLDDNEDT